MHSRGLISNTLFITMIRSGYEELKRHVDQVNKLNVFPVPDGDTGTNMMLSFNAGIERMQKAGSDASLQKLAGALATGLLMGARGNSGVILSQLFRGFQAVFPEANETSAKNFAQALQSGVSTAYKAVSRPVEGTILTVAKAASVGAKRAVAEKNFTIEDVLFEAIKQAESALEMTPQLLPVLKQAGVVDSGGQGLVYILTGFYNSLTDAKSLSMLEEGEALTTANALTTIHGEGEYGYCTEAFVRVNPEKDVHENEVKNQLSAMGDSLLVVKQDQYIKIHVHTFHPGDVLEVALHYGELLQVKIDNMSEQARSLEPSKTTNKSFIEQRKQCGLVAIASGEGFSQIFREIGVDYIINGGQSMNPATKDILSALDYINADEVILLPNNRNIFMAAEQAAQISKGRIHVLPTRSLGEGVAAALAYHSAKDSVANLKAMEEAAKAIQSGAVTGSVRDSKIGTKTILKGDFLGLLGEDINWVDVQRSEVLRLLIEHFCHQGAELVTVFYQSDQLLHELGEVIQAAAKEYPFVEFEMQYGGQPVYDYLLAAE